MIHGGTVDHFRPLGLGFKRWGESRTPIPGRIGGRDSLPRPCRGRLGVCRLVWEDALTPVGLKNYGVLDRECRGPTSVRRVHVGTHRDTLYTTGGGGQTIRYTVYVSTVRVDRTPSTTQESVRYCDHPSRREWLPNSSSPNFFEERVTPLPTDGSRLGDRLVSIFLLGSVLVFLVDRLGSGLTVDRLSD